MATYSGDRVPYRDGGGGGHRRGSGGRGHRGGRGGGGHRGVTDVGIYGLLASQSCYHSMLVPCWFTL